VGEKVLNFSYSREQGTGNREQGRRKKEDAIKSRVSAIRHLPKL
jgi:hypothetical protein